MPPSSTAPPRSSTPTRTAAGGSADAAALPPSTPATTRPLAVGESRVRVCARVRPLTPREAGSKPAVRVTTTAAATAQGNAAAPPTDLIVSGLGPAGRTSQRYSLDRVFTEDSSQATVFEETAAPLVRVVVGGANAALFAYGQTGSGKTHSMLGVDVWQLFASSTTTASSTPSSRGVVAPPQHEPTITATQRQALERSEQRGVIPRTMQLVFQLLRECQHKVSVSYLEIYNEKILDLLSAEVAASGKDAPGLELREDKHGAVHVVNATVRRVHNLDEVLDALWRGARSRAVSATDMNEHSSRSHTIFQVAVETRGTATVRGTKAKLNLVDLAGSEKWRPHQLAEFSEQRIAEMTSINQSLSNLGQCVRGLLQPGRNHIPYRNSKLTRLLQDSLGGDARLGFIVCVSPSELAYEETVSTLQFADRAKRIVVREPPAAPPQPLASASASALRGRAAAAAAEDAAPPAANGSGDVEAALDARATSLVDRLRARLQRTPDEVEAALPALHEYIEHLRRRTVESLTASERLTLMEWAVLAQAEDAHRAAERSREEIAGLRAELADKDAALAALRAEARAAAAEVKATTAQLVELRRASAAEIEALQDRISKLSRGGGGNSDRHGGLGLGLGHDAARRDSSSSGGAGAPVLAPRAGGATWRAVTGEEDAESSFESDAGDAPRRRGGAENAREGGWNGNRALAHAPESPWTQPEGGGGRRSADAGEGFRDTDASARGPAHGGSAALNGSRAWSPPRESGGASSLGRRSGAASAAASIGTSSPAVFRSSRLSAGQGGAGSASPRAVTGGAAASVSFAPGGAVSYGGSAAGAGSGTPGQSWRVPAQPKPASAAGGGGAGVAARPGASKPGAWERYVDARTARPYYHNRATGATTWTRPEGVVDS